MSHTKWTMHLLGWCPSLWRVLWTGATFFFLPLCQILLAGEYQWPLAAPRALTSTFGEYRPGRFHAGLDIKTWGREGYPILAVDDGYVWRVRTSPWGYGRAVYFRLENGSTAVYAHLSGFSDEIEQVVAEEQIRHGKYSVNLFLNAGQIKATKGDTLGYSGRTGIGYPHLHFEYRDRAGRATNPLLQGFKVQDTISPTIQAVAIVPLDAGSQVDGAHVVKPLGLRWYPKRNRYLSSGSTSVVGRLGVAVKVYDRADASQLSNRLAPFRLRLFVDGREVYQTRYTRLAYHFDWRMDEMNQVELDRNFVLRKLGEGTYHNLYRLTGNRLSIYGKYRQGDGVLYSGEIAPRGKGMHLKPGFHLLRIEAEDVNGNRSSAEIKVLANRRPRVEGVAAESRGDSVYVSARIKGATRDSVQVSVSGSSDEGDSWQVLHEGFSGPDSQIKIGIRDQYMLYRVTAWDAFGESGFQTCAPHITQIGAASGEMLTCHTHTYADYTVFVIESDRILAGPPYARVRWPSGEERVLEVSQTELTAYEAVVEFDGNVVKGLDLTVSAVDLDGNAGHYSMKLHQQQVLTTGGTVRSEDGLAEIRFDSSRVYEPMYGGAVPMQVAGADRMPAIGLGYKFSPDNVPFQGKVHLFLRYPDGFERPEKLGVYEQKSDTTWSFLNNVLDTEAGTVSARVSHFSTYAILLDELPPVVKDLEPEGVIHDDLPTLAAEIRDEGTGIGREEDIEVRLDGNPMIFEFDPEEDRVFVQLKDPLEEGLHRFTVSVKDMCGNLSQASGEFTVRRGQNR
jgi:hypothetical protein